MTAEVGTSELTVIIDLPARAGYVGTDARWPAAQTLTAAEHDIALSLAAPSAPVRKVFDITSLDRALATHATLRIALAEARDIVGQRHQPLPPAGQ